MDRRGIAVHRPSGMGDRVVAAGVIGVAVGIHNPADGPRRQPPDCGDHAVAQLCKPCIDYKNAFVAHLHGDIGASTNQHVDVALNVKRLDVARGLGQQRAAGRCDHN